LIFTTLQPSGKYLPSTIGAPKSKNIPSIVFLAVLLAFAGGLDHHPRSRHACHNISDSGKISFRSLAAFE
jgi:hypothetical protein